MMDENCKIMDRDDRLHSWLSVSWDIRQIGTGTVWQTHAGNGGHDLTHQCQLCREGGDSGWHIQWWTQHVLFFTTLNTLKTMNCIFNSRLLWCRDLNVKCYMAKLKSVPVSGATQVRLHGQGISSSELRIQHSAFKRQPTWVYSTLHENSGIQIPFQDKWSKWYQIIAEVGQKG